MKKDDFIFETFLRLTNKTYPYGYEEGLVEDLLRSGLFPSGIEKDPHGNYFYKIGNSRTIFASHLDTACKEQVGVTHVFEDNMIKTDGKSILGADDKAGVAIMINMINHNISGLYYFFIGEEVGCIGSGLASKYGDFKGKFDRVISFDRRGTDSVITYQSSSRCCSDDFARSLSKQLNLLGMNYKPDDTGVYTDSAEFVDIISECTNLSVGYYKEHTHNESQDIEHLTKLAEACLFVDWETLPTRRNFAKKEYKSYGTSHSSYNTSYSNSFLKKKSHVGKKSRNDYGYHDDWYDQTPTAQNKSKDLYKEKGRKFYDDGSGLIKIPNVKEDVTFSGKSSCYDWILDKFSSKITLDELEIIKEQYLDMNTSQDILYYQYLHQYVTDDCQ